VGADQEYCGVDGELYALSIADEATPSAMPRIMAPTIMPSAPAYDGVEKRIKLKKAATTAALKRRNMQYLPYLY
jgi:hypothetical protein